MTEPSFPVRVVLDDNEQALRLFGHGDAHLKTIERLFNVRVSARGSHVHIDGAPGEAGAVAELFEGLKTMLREGQRLTSSDIDAAIRMASRGERAIGDVMGETVVVTARGRAIRAKTAGQKKYIEAMEQNGIVFCIGPAGTGKTYLAMAMAIKALKSQKVHRIILTRPAVEAGEKLGFLPGDLQEKVNPYLRPLYDALFDMLGVETFQRYMDRGIIEVAPLAYMRGRTLDDSFIILDEAQNTTPEQMKMFLTRMGFGSRLVVTGDVTQVDLPREQHSGLRKVSMILSDVEGIAFVYLADEDVVRHPLVQKIIRAYENYEREAAKRVRYDDPDFRGLDPWFVRSDGASADTGPTPPAPRDGPRGEGTADGAAAGGGPREGEGNSEPAGDEGPAGGAGGAAP